MLGRIPPLPCWAPRKDLAVFRAAQVGKGVPTTPAMAWSWFAVVIRWASCDEPRFLTRKGFLGFKSGQQGSKQFSSDAPWNTDTLDSLAVPVPNLLRIRQLPTRLTRKGAR